MTRSSAQLTLGPETRRLMREVFEANEPPESATLLRMATVRERRRLAQGEERVRKRYAFAGALAALCISGTALGVGVSAGIVDVEFFPARREHKSPKPESSSESSGLRKVLRISAPDDALKAQGSVNLRQTVTKPATTERTTAVRSTAVPSAAEPTVSRPSETVLSTAKKSMHGTSTGKNAQGGSDDSNAPQLDAKTSAANWQEVAGAMRAGEDARAREAITPLTESLDRETRDSAELVKLRIELGSHREGKLSASSSQRARLEHLAEDGASPSIRVSARRLLERVNPVGVRDFSEIDDHSQ